MIYVASPYSDPDPLVREQRFDAVCRAVAALMHSGVVAFSPIVHGHPLVAHGLPVEWPFWERFDCEHLSRCDELVVLMLDGWRNSRGVRAEIRIAGDLGISVRFLDPADVAGDATGSPTAAHVAKEAEG
ncbi:MAG: DUF1937 family protein [Planctomycetaceae bacterium]